MKRAALWAVGVRVGGPTAVEADDAEKRQIVPDRGVELHRVLAKRAVAVQADDLRIGLGGLSANCKGQPHPHRAKGSRVEAVPARGQRSDRLAAQVKLSCPLMTRIVSRRRV